MDSKFLDPPLPAAEVMTYALADCVTSASSYRELFGQVLNLTGALWFVHSAAGHFLSNASNNHV